MPHLKEWALCRSGSKLPRSTFLFISIAQNAVQFILEDLELLLGYDSVSVTTRNDKTIISLQEDLEFVRYFLERVQEGSVLNSTISDLAIDFAALMEVLLDTTDSYVHRNISPKNITSGDFLEHCSEVASLVRRIKTVEEVIVKVPDDEIGHSCTGNSSRRTDSSIMGENAMVGFDAEVTELLDKLVGGRQQLEVISIIGMGGIGKTTLAKRLYHDPVVAYHFHVHAWASASPDCELRNLLRDILSSIVQDKDSIFSMSNDEMGEKLYKSLKGRRYLIVLDDIWDGICNQLIMYLPKDDNKSRILFTSRIQGLSNAISCKNSQHFLRFLTPDESWNLFKQKVFPDNNVPEELADLGKCIVAKCKGLPLAIVVIAGVLAKEEKTVKSWREFARNIRQSNGGNSICSFFQQYMDILELSYEHLPKPLKSCFLYLGTFPSDYEIPPKMLIWSWISEGFIQHTTGKRLEDVAKDHLMDLINRSLVIVVKQSSDGGIKSCKIHDLLRELCRKKAKEKKFLQPICVCNMMVLRKPFCRIEMEPNVIDPFSECQPYFHLYHSSHYVSGYDVFNNQAMSAYKFLRRLELRNTLINFPEQISQLLHLRYLALRIDCIKNLLPSSIFKLWNLETCIFDVEKGGRVELPLNIWKMVNLRHLQVSQEVIFHGPREDTSPILLENLQTISQLCPSGSIKDVLARTPNLRNLGFHLTLSKCPEPFCFPDLAHLNLLETLKFEYQTLGMVPFSIPHLHKFPPSLKKLTLIGSHVHWEEMSIIGLLPNLEILKIKDNFFSGPLWETSDEGFRRLKFLKLSHMDLHKWISSGDHFPRLEHIVLNGCLDLEEIPPEIGDNPTLQTIEVYRSSNSAMESAKQILESQKLMGSEYLKVFFYHHLQEY